jgi:hypothetical protein
MKKILSILISIIIFNACDNTTSNTIKTDTSTNTIDTLEFDEKMRRNIDNNYFDETLFSDTVIFNFKKIEYFCITEREKMQKWYYVLSFIVNTDYVVFDDCRRTSLSHCDTIDVVKKQIIKKQKIYSNKMSKNIFLLFNHSYTYILFLTEYGEIYYVHEFEEERDPDAPPLDRF